MKHRILPCPWCGSTFIMRDYERSNKAKHEVNCLACGKQIVAPRGYATIVWNYLHRHIKQKQRDESAPVYIPPAKRNNGGGDA